MAVGMGPALTFRRVVLPQMWRFALPGLGNVWMVPKTAPAACRAVKSCM